MACDIHRECPTSCRNWSPCLTECDHEACQDAIGFAAWMENQTIAGRAHVLSTTCWCNPEYEVF